MTGKTEFAVHIGHLQQMHHTKPVVYIMAGGTLHLAAEEHIIVDSTPQSTIGGGRWK